MIVTLCAIAGAVMLWLAFAVEAQERAIVAVYLSARPGRWVSSLELVKVCGWFAYSAARALQWRDLVEHKFDPAPERNGRAKLYYRWKGTGKWCSCKACWGGCPRQTAVLDGEFCAPCANSHPESAMLGPRS